MHCSGDGDCGLSCSEGKFAWFVMCTVLVTETVACLVLDSVLALFLMCTVLLTETVACPVSGCELASFLMCYSGDRNCGLSCFRG